MTTPIESTPSNSNTYRKTFGIEGKGSLTPISKSLNDSIRDSNSDKYIARNTYAFIMKNLMSSKYALSPGNTGDGKKIDNKITRALKKCSGPLS